MAFFVGGQLFPRDRRAADIARRWASRALTPVARRFGCGTVGAIAVLVAIGIPMASAGTGGCLWSTMKFGPHSPSF